MHWMSKETYFVNTKKCCISIETNLISKKYVFHIKCIKRDVLARAELQPSAALFAPLRLACKKRRTLCQKRRILHQKRPTNISIPAAKCRAVCPSASCVLTSALPVGVVGWVVAGRWCSSCGSSSSRSVLCVRWCLVIVVGWMDRC